MAGKDSVLEEVGIGYCQGVGGWCPVAAVGCHPEAGVGWQPAAPLQVVVAWHQLGLGPVPVVSGLAG